MDANTLKQFQQFQLFQQMQQQQNQPPSKPKKQFNNTSNPNFSTTLSQPSKPSGPSYKELSLDNDKLRNENRQLKDKNDDLNDIIKNLKEELEKYKKMSKTSTISSDDIKNVIDSDISSIISKVVNNGGEDIPIETSLDCNFNIYQIINYIYKNDKHFIDPKYQLKIILCDRIDRYSFYDNNNNIFIDDNIKNIFNKIISYIKEMTMNKIHINIKKEKNYYCIFCKKFDDSNKKSK